MEQCMVAVKTISKLQFPQNEAISAVQ